MHNNEIDRITLEGLKESERRNEIFADQAKLRIWDAIDKPKTRKIANWWLVSAMAAAVSFFIVSTFLFLKLETQKKELNALQSYVNGEISAKGSTYEKVLTEVEEIIDKKPLAIKEPTPIEKVEKTIQQVQFNNLKELAEASIEISDPIISESNLSIVILPKPEIEIPEILHQELSTQVVQSPELDEETFHEPKSKKPRKLKFKIGNGSKVHDYQNTYAFNIKL